MLLKRCRRGRVRTLRYNPAQIAKCPQWAMKLKKKESWFDAPHELLIWGKLINSKSPRWPARIISTRGKRLVTGQELVYVRFLGTNNCGWVYFEGYTSHGRVKQRFNAATHSSNQSKSFVNALRIAQDELAAPLPQLMQVPQTMCDDDMKRSGTVVLYD